MGEEKRVMICSEWERCTRTMVTLHCATHKENEFCPTLCNLAMGGKGAVCREATEEEQVYHTMTSTRE